MQVVRSARFVVGAIIAAFVMAGVGMSAANAQAQTPAQLLQQNPNGGQLLINALEQLVLTNPATFNTILGSVGGASQQQKVAIATALSQAAKTMVLTNEPLAAEWQEKILAVTDPAFKTAAVNAFGDVKLGAVGGAPGTGPLGGPNGAPGGVGALQDIRSTPFPTTPFTFTAGVTGLGFVGGAAGAALVNGAGPTSASTSSGVQ